MGKRKLDQSYSIDISDNGPVTGLRQDPEVIDLADDSPPATSGRSAPKTSQATAVVLATNSPTPQEQRQKIMAHAALVNSRKRVKPAVDEAADAKTASQQMESSQITRPQAAAAGKDANAAKQAIIQHAAQLAPNNSLLAQLHAERLARQQLANPQHSQDKSAEQRLHKQAAPEPVSELSLLTYNVWFEEDIALQQRMCAIGDIIQEHGYPHFICLQEVTPCIYHLFQQSPWWHRYAASQPQPQPYYTVLLYRKDTFTPATPFHLHAFPNSAMGRSMLWINGTIQGCKFRVATSHLESPCGRNQMFSKQRVEQCAEGFELLDDPYQANVLWAGDMNWNSDDGEPPLPAGWVDAWKELKPKDPGLTYDGKNNPMLGPYNRLRIRLDRVFCKVCSYKLSAIKMVGMQPVPGVTHTKHYKKGPTTMPVLPSDHFGILAVFKYAV